MAEPLYVVDRVEVFSASDAPEPRNRKTVKAWAESLSAHYYEWNPAEKDSPCLFDATGGARERELTRVVVYGIWEI